MSPAEARRLADNLVTAAQRAEAEGRDTIAESDLDVFLARLDEKIAKADATIAAIPDAAT